MKGDSESALLAPSSPCIQTFKTQWLQFLVGETDAVALRVFEALFTITFWMWMGHCFLEWREWLTNWGFHLNVRETALMGHPAPFPLLQNGYQVALLGAAGAAGSLCVVFNRWRKFGLLVLFAFSLYVQGADVIVASTVNKFFIAIYGILLLCPGYMRDGTSGRQQVSAVAIRVIQATLILEYFASGIAKAFVGDWLKYGDVLYTVIQGEFRTDFAAWCLRSLPVWSWTVMQWTALLFELEAPVLFGVRKLRPIAFVIGIGLHLMIALMMKDLIFFSAQMWTFYALFVTPEQWRWVGAALKRLGPGSKI